MPPKADYDAFLREPRFNQTFKDQQRGWTVSFADCGDQNGRPVLFCLPSSNSRFIAGSVDGLCKSLGVRLIAMDRPGSGQTPRCPLSERVQTSCDLYLSLLEHLNLRNVHLITHSAGSIYALHLLSTSPKRFKSPPTLSMISPWVADVKFHVLDLIPSGLIANEHVLMPSLMSIGSSIGAAFVWSGSVLPSRQAANKTGEDDGDWSKQFYDRDGMSKAVLRAMLSQSIQAMGQDHLLCLGKSCPPGTIGVGREWLKKTLDSIAHLEPVIRVVMAEGDGLVSKASRDWLDAQLKADSRIKCEVKRIPKLGHDDVLFTNDGIPWALELA